MPVDDSIIRNSITIGLPDIRSDELLDNDVFERFTDALSLLDNWHSDDIWLFSVHSYNKYTNVTFIVQHAQIIQRYKVLSFLSRIHNKRLNCMRSLGRNSMRLTRHPDYWIVSALYTSIISRATWWWGGLWCSSHTIKQYNASKVYVLGNLMLGKNLPLSFVIPFSCKLEIPCLASCRLDPHL